MTALRAQPCLLDSTWDHESVFASFDAWREEYQAAVSLIGDIDAFKGSLA